MKTSLIIVTKTQITRNQVKNTAFGYSINLILWQHHNGEVPKGNYQEITLKMENYHENTAANTDWLYFLQRRQNEVAIISL